MGYPAPSDFASSTPYSAWWQFARADGVPTVCATSGANLLLRARATVQLGPGTWDDTFQSQLVALARGYQTSDSSWASLVTALQNDAQSRRVGKASLLFAIWLAWYRSANLRLDAISVPDSFVSIPWARALTSSGLSMVCWNPNTQSSPEILTDSERALAEQQSTQGIRSESAVQSNEPPSGPRGASNAAVWVIAGGLVLITAWAFHQTRKGRPA